MEKYALSDLRTWTSTLPWNRDTARRSGRRVRLVVDSLSTLFTSMDAADILDFTGPGLSNCVKAGS